MNIWLERFASDLVRAPKRVQKLVDRLIIETECGTEQAERLRLAAAKFAIPPEEFAEKKSLAKHISVQSDRLDQYKEELLSFVANANRDILEKLIR